VDGSTGSIEEELLGRPVSGFTHSTPIQRGGAEVGDGPSGPRTNPDALSNACAHFVVDLRVHARRDLQRDSHRIRDSFVERARFGQTRHGNFQMAVGLDVDGPTVSLEDFMLQGPALHRLPIDTATLHQQFPLTRRLEPQRGAPILSMRRVDW